VDVELAVTQTQPCQPRIAFDLVLIDLQFTVNVKVVVPAVLAASLPTADTVIV
jgi:hypothetical protein